MISGERTFTLFPDILKPLSLGNKAGESCNLLVPAYRVSGNERVKLLNTTNFNKPYF